MAIAPELIIPAASQTLADRIKSIFTSRFPQAEVQFFNAHSPRISGNIIWDGFEGFSFRERHRMAWEALEEQFTENELEQVSGFYTCTSFEDPDKEDNLF